MIDVLGNFANINEDLINREIGNSSYFECPQYFISDEYYLMMRLQERTESHISFQITLPYVSDMDNMELKTNLIDGTVNREYYVADSDSLPNQYKVSHGIKFNAGYTEVQEEECRNYDEYLITTREYSIKTSGSKLYLNSDGYVELIDTNLYEFVGWYIKENDGVDFLTPGTNTVGGRTFDVWAPDASAEKITSLGKSLDCDATIYLVMTRKEISITYDDGTWWKNNAKDVGEGTPNYDVDTMLRYDYLNGKFSGTTATYPGGLVAVIPGDIGGDDAFNTPDMDDGLGRSPKTTIKLMDSSTPTNDMIRNSLYISYADDDVINRVNYMLNTSLNGTEVKSNKFEHNSVAIVGGMSTEARKTTFDVLLKDDNNWFFVGVPTGDATTNNAPKYYTTVELYDMPQTAPTEATSWRNPEKIGTYNFKQDTIQMIQSLAITSPDKPIDYISLYITKDTNYRLYDGLYNSEVGESLAPSYSKITFRYDTPFSGYSDPANIKTPMLTGYRVVVNGSGTDYKHDKNNSMYSRGGFYNDFSLASYSSTVSIYPVWELINVYKITIVDSEGKISMPQTTHVMEGGSAVFTQENFSSVTINNKVSSTEFSTGTFKTLTSDNKVFAGFIDRELDSAKTRYGTGTDGDFNNYGVLKVSANGTSSYSVVAGTHVNSSGDYSFTITPTAHVSLVAVWLVRGYSVNYAYVGGTPLGSDSNISTCCNKCTVDVSETSEKCAKEISYPNLLEGLPVKIAHGFDYITIKGTNFDTNGEKPFTAATAANNTVEKGFVITDGLVLTGYYATKASTEKWSANNLKFISQLTYDSGKYTVYFKLEHNDHSARHGIYNMLSMYIANTERVSNCSDGIHTYTDYRYWACFYCDYTYTEKILEEDYEKYPDASWHACTAENGHVQNSTKTYTSVRCSVHCEKNIYCSNCDAQVAVERQEHPSMVRNVARAATCTTSERIYYSCSEPCGYRTAEENGDGPLGHLIQKEYTAFQSDTNPDCTKLRDKYECQRSGCTYGYFLNVGSSSSSSSGGGGGRPNNIGGTTVMPYAAVTPPIIGDTGETMPSRHSYPVPNMCGTHNYQCTNSYYNEAGTRTLRCKVSKEVTRDHNFSSFEYFKLTFNGWDAITCSDTSYYCIPKCTYCSGYMRSDLVSVTKTEPDQSKIVSNQYAVYRIVINREYWDWEYQQYPYGSASIAFMLWGSTLHQHRYKLAPGYASPCAKCEVMLNGDSGYGDDYYCQVYDHIKGQIRYVPSSSGVARMAPFNYEYDIVFGVSSEYYLTSSHGMDSMYKYHTSYLYMNSQVPLYDWGLGTTWYFDSVTENSNRSDEFNMDMKDYMTVNVTALRSSLNTYFKNELAIVKGMADNRHNADDFAKYTYNEYLSYFCYKYL